MEKKLFDGTIPINCYYYSLDDIVKQCPNPIPAFDPSKQIQPQTDEFARIMKQNVSKIPAYAEYAVSDFCYESMCSKPWGSYELIKDQKVVQKCKYMDKVQEELLKSFKKQGVEIRMAHDYTEFPNPKFL